MPPRLSPRSTKSGRSQVLVSRTETVIKGRRMTKLYIGQLSAEITNEELHQLFTAKGFLVTSARVICDREGGRSRGFGFVGFGSDDDAERAHDELNGKDDRGRKML